MDKFSDFPTNLTAPGRDAAAVSPNDLSDLAVLPRALFVGQGGALALRMAGGQDVVFQGVQSGAILPVRARRVMATGTTATAILAIW
ncbi:MAG TPA: hypothetical protein PLI43_18400 [Albidovulum sp.]|uniref:spike base protein, RCAP_Rcc01079 family n=1 Tax=Albidovulum sp. TaxID=1872424 RepID=UPI002C0AD593|nr:hypothetical protein [Albidovulum sp.]